VGGGVQLGPLGTAATDWPIVTAPGDYDNGEFGGMKIGRGNRSTRTKPATAPLFPPQIPLDQTRVRTRAAAVGSQRHVLTLMISAAFCQQYICAFLKISRNKNSVFLSKWTF
jgi:hypothetical protein